MVTLRDRRILATEQLYGMVTIEAVHHAEFKDCKPNASVKVLSRLVAAGWLRSYPLFGRTRYYRANGPLGPQTLPTAAAVLSYCVLSNKPKFSREEMSERYPSLPTEGQVYCRDGEGICQLRVSLGGASDALVRKLIAHHQGLYHIDGYRALIASGTYSMRLLVPTEGKAREINRFLHQSPPPFSVVPVVIPDLLQLLAGETHARPCLPPEQGQPIATGQVSGEVAAV